MKHPFRIALDLFKAGRITIAELNEVSANYTANELWEVYTQEERFNILAGAIK